MRKGSKRKVNLTEIAEDAKVVSTTENSENKGSLLTSPQDLETDFEFEKPPSEGSNPLSIPLAGETVAEGKTMQNLGFEMEEDFEAPPSSSSSSPPPPPNDKKVSFDEATKSNVIDDDVPPPNPNENDIFDEVGDVEGGMGGGTALPDDFVSWSAEQQAEWIVNTELVVAHGFIHNRTKISTIDIKQKLLKYKIPREIGSDVNEIVKTYNDEVEKTLVVSTDAKKALKSSWVAVLKQYTNISEKITPESALLLNHALFFGQLWMVSNQFKKQGISIVQDISDIFKNYNQNQKQQGQQGQQEKEGK